jgi:hypothetical protein
MDAQPIGFVVLIVVFNGRGYDIACAVAGPGTALCAGGKQWLHKRKSHSQYTPMDPDPEHCNS